jgi:CheY-like chemotaxis protein
LHAQGRPGPHLCLIVSDTGTGIPQAIMEKIFDPFFTTKEAGKGTGLGLSTVCGIVKSHDGFLQVETEVGRGTRFQVYLPALSGQTEQPFVAGPAPLLLGHGEGILVIDDDPAICEMMRATLEAYGYRVFMAADGQAGVDEYGRRLDEIHLILTDMMMPGLTGQEVIRALRSVNPGCRIIAMSGLMDIGAAGQSLIRERLELLPKPFDTDVLLATIHRMLTMT